MGAVLGLVIVATTLGAAPSAAPGPVAGEPPMRVIVTGPNDGETEIAAYLRERVLAAWPRSEAPKAQRTIEIRVRPAEAHEVEIAVLEGHETWAQRSFDTRATDAVALRLAAWLFVRSTVSRGVAEPPLSNPTGSASTGGPAGAGGSASVHAQTPAPVASGTPGASFGETVSRHRAAAPKPALLATMSAGPDRLWAVGASAMASARLGDVAVAWAELGYAMSPAGRGLVLHRWPVGGALGVAPPYLAGLELGFAGYAEAKLASAGHRQRWAVGASVGPVARWCTPASGRSGLVLRLAWLWAVARQQYLTGAGTSNEAPWTLAVGVGVRWP